MHKLNKNESSSVNHNNQSINQLKRANIFSARRSQSSRNTNYVLK